MSDADREAKAREVLANEYELIGDAMNANRIRSGQYVCEEIDVALRAIEKTFAQTIPDAPSTDVQSGDAGFHETGGSCKVQALREAIEQAAYEAVVKWSNGDQPKPIKAMVADAVIAALAAPHPIARADEQGVEALKQAILAECAKRGGSCNETLTGLLAVNVEIEPVKVVGAVIDAVFSNARADGERKRG